MQRIKADVLIIGGGGAACRAALEASSKGADVLMVQKKTIGDSGSTACGVSEIAAFNVAGAIEIEDNEASFYSDIIDAGIGMADPVLAQLMVEHAKSRYEDLARWGLICERNPDGSFLGLHGCFSTYNRGYAIKGHGAAIVKVLLKEIRSRSNISVMEHSMIIDLLVKNGVYAGALGVNNQKELIFFETKTAVIAAGGASQIFKNNLNPTDVAGDSYALAWRAGANVMNMEFMQGGIGFQYPIMSLFQAHFWPGLPRILNRNKEEFVKHYLPEGVSYTNALREHSYHFPFSCRDSSMYVDIAVQREIAAGNGTKHGGVYIDFSHFTDEYINGLTFDLNLKKLWPLALEHFMEYGIDLMHDDVEISIISQAINGGVQIGNDAMSTIPGIFAAGEAAAGPHGADRLGGNMLLASQVFGKIAGESAAAYALANSALELDERQIKNLSGEVLDILFRDIEFEAYDERLKQINQNNLLISRSKESLATVIDAMDGLEKALVTAPSRKELSTDSMILFNKITVSKIMAESALRRKESRGSHYRMDYPEKDEIRFGKPNTLKKSAQQMKEE